MTMVLVFTGKNKTEALKPMKQIAEEWIELKPQHPQNLGFENALRANAADHGRKLPSKLYFAQIENELIIDRLSAKLQVPEIITAFDAKIMDCKKDSPDILDKLSEIKAEYRQTWKEHADPYGQVWRMKANELNRDLKAEQEAAWTKVYKEHLSTMDLWSD